MQRRVVTVFEIGMIAALAGWFVSLDSSVVEARRFLQDETRAWLVLNDLREGEVAFRGSVRIDRDGDGIGEFGFLRDVLVASPESSRIRGLRAVGRGVYETEDSSYDISFFLPDDAGHGVGEDDGDRVSSQEAEQCFVAYAWPAVYGRTGIRAFCMLADGRSLITENGVKQYGGAKRRPPANAALFAKEDRLCGSNALSRPSNDHQPWIPVSR